jgi:catechol 2,3-dioxygenase-like lactoylglutathione lyase family enzyme
MGPLLLCLDAVTVPVPDLDEGMAFYCAVLGHDLLCAGFSSDASLARLARDSRC